MRPLFKDPLLREEMERNGYAVVRLLSESQVSNLRRLYEETIDRDAVGDLYESSRHNLPEVNRRINQAIRAALAGAAEEVFDDCRLYGGTFMTKSCRGSNVLPLHQDWSVVEESEHNTYFIWCPLQAVDALNGGVFLVKGSHQYFSSIRSGTYPSDRFILPYQLRHCLKSVRLQAGEALIYSDRLFHGSHANQGDEDRVVVTGRVVERDAQLVYFHKRNEREVDVYPADEAFYLSQIDTLAKGQPPVGLSKLYTRAYQHEATTDASLRAKIKEHHPAPAEGAAQCRLFKDPAVQEAFERNGYVVIDLIGPEQVAELRAFYSGLEHAPMPEYGFQVSLDNERSDFVREVSERLRSFMRPYVDEQFQEHQVFTGSFVVKGDNPLGLVPPHQDWTFVDEQRYWSATIWCPLVDVHMGNGGLGVIQGSHRFYDHVRPSPSPQYTPPFKDQLPDILPYLKIIEMKAGQALVFDNRTFHASLPNCTGQTRIAFGLGVTHRDAALQHFYLLPNQEKMLVERYEVGPEYFYSYNNARLSAMHERGDRPDGLNRSGLFEYTCADYDTRQLVGMIEAAGNVRDASLAEEIAALFPHATATHTAAALADSNLARRPPVWRVYTPVNVYREIQHRLARRSSGEPLWKIYTPARIMQELRHRLAKR